MNNEKCVNFRRIIEEMNDTYKRKNADYGNSFDETINKCGLMVAAGRMYDKLNRFITLVDSGRDGQVKEESIIDTLTDLANYAVMTRMYVEGHSGKLDQGTDYRGDGVDESARVNRKFYKEAEE